jgi:hypothetical protein
MLLKPAASFVIALLLAWVWAAFVAPAISRGFGLPMLSGWNFIRRNQHLSKSDYVRSCGVVAVGSGLFLLLTFKQVMYCELVVGKPPYFKGSYMGERLIICLLAGWIFGSATAPAQNITDLPVR